jgi:Family of unknown function (DUF5985)
MAIAPAAVYLLCFATSLLCAVLLVRSYARTRGRLLFWTALCFVGFAGNNLFLFVDLVVFPMVDLMVLRHLCTLAGLTVLLYGFIWETE